MNKQVLQQAINTYGHTSQKLMLFEEMAELQKEVCKSLRGSDNREEIVEELADVYIMLEQIKMMYDVCDGTVDQFIKKKINRLDKRLKEKQHHETNII